MSGDQAHQETTVDVDLRGLLPRLTPFSEQCATVDATQRREADQGPVASGRSIATQKMKPWPTLPAVLSALAGCVLEWQL